MLEKDTPKERPSSPCEAPKRLYPNLPLGLRVGKRQSRDAFETAALDADQVDLEQIDWTL